jgi:hypothetical protein
LLFRLIFPPVPGMEFFVILIRYLMSATAR